MIFVRRRLIWSASQPDVAAPTIAPRRRIATVSCCCPVRVQVQVLLHEQHRAADDARVVAEEEAADRSDDRNAEQASVASRLAQEAAVSAHVA
jgi:hypothetical protein